MNVKKIRVLIVDDTLVGQNLLKGILASDTRFEVVGIVGNGRQAIDFVRRQPPDIISMDIQMPVLDGVEATRLIMEEMPVPIMIVSSLYNQDEVKMSFRILEAGALTILPRPFGPGHPQFTQTANRYRNTLKTLSEIKVKALRPLPNRRSPEEPAKPVTLRKNSGYPAFQSVAAQPEYKLVAIGASAGGPQAIQVILKNLSERLKCPLLIVQHIDKNFAKGYCDWLASVSNIPVRAAAHGELLQPGVGYLSPGDFHLGLLNKGVAALSNTPPERGLRPAVAHLFREVLAVYGHQSIAVILSGMGEDGAAEMKKLRDAGALTIAQDATSALVNGMPGQAVKLNAATLILTPEEIALEINKYCM